MTIKEPIRTALKVALLPLFVAIPIAVMAQSVIQRADKPYFAKPEIEFVFPGTETAALKPEIRFSITQEPAAPVTATANPDSASSAVSALKPQNAVAIAEAIPAKVWAISIADKTIRQTLMKWGKQAGYTVIWDVPKDINIEAEASIAGTFEDAVKAVLESITASEYPVEAVIYENRVIRVIKTARNANTGSNK